MSTEPTETTEAESDADVTSADDDERSRDASAATDGKDPEPTDDAASTDASGEVDPDAGAVDGALAGRVDGEVATPGMGADSATTAATTVSAETTTDADGRWLVGTLAALVAGSAGVFLGNTGAFIAAIVGLVYAGYATVSRAPSAPLAVERTVRPAAPAPGDRIEVTVRAENVGEAPLADLRLADDPPADLTVVDGDTRVAGTVEAGDALSVTYTLRGARGAYDFGDVVTVARSASGDGVRRAVHEVPERLVCHAPVEGLPLAGQTGVGAGRVDTDSGGEGVEFYATREYVHGDPANRVDWNRYAATGELTTVTYRESRAATVAFVVDGRFDHRRAPGEPTACELCCYATVRVADALLDAQNQVGVAVFADGYSGPRVDGALDPATGTEQSIRIRELVRTKFGVDVDDRDVTTGRGSTDAPSRRSDRGSSRSEALFDAVPAGAQVVFVTPLLDDVAVEAVESLAARDHVTTVVSPDVTAGDSVGGTVERVVRTERVDSLAGTPGVRVADWSPDEPLQAAIDRASTGWER